MKIALSGYGKMGREVESAALERGHAVVAREGRLSGNCWLDDADVVIDFSNAEQIDEVIEAACEAGVNLVIGTTGWNERLEEVRRRCKEANLGVVHAANFSPGAIVTFALAREAARLISKFGGYEAGIEERHHSQKKDAPSGTALRIAREVEAGSDGTVKPVISSSRVGSETGLHTLFFDSKDDLIELSHRARGREGFARGAVIAAEMLENRKGFFTFEELIGLQKGRGTP